MNPQKILIIRLSSIGDIVLATPLIRVLRNKFTASQIDFIVKKEFSELLKFNPNLTNLIEFDSKNGFKELLKLKILILKERYDLIIDIHNNLRSLFLRTLSGAKVVKINKRIFKRFLLVKFKVNLYKNAIHTVEKYIEPVSKFSIKNDNQGLEVFVPEDTIDKMKKKINFSERDLYIAIAPSAKHETKRWLPERFAQLGDELVEKFNAKIILLGGKEDKARCEIVEHLMKNKPINLCGQTTLLESSAVLSLCKLLITNDSGLMHIGSAMKTKIVAIFGSTVKEFGFFPYGTQSIVVEKNIPCRPCSHIGREKCPKGHFKCMRDIEVEDVFNACVELMK
ncbi:heptosyltransferase-2 [Candidatus Kryptonium thompsonii]|uniref:lipopolysaccharide heptosyltransferase II n=2 Tax=Candidatus Kryptonium thompsonii TaxID=1633631 RepID=A0A0P1MPP0_9BACT|nr:lipopolysaccharide heptosyltransferase II [Candidatus Kryptonium thompsoni]CUS78141.1 heptosyltransferase-2 [Candidatus Kryptonium thompsoni]CUS82817.1 heptosyltransferase-2 [Candidatus Kryptonium thompsoni]CUS87813.1 heptosyltransferase-2 [Candidatus Kryptonium thompsoni]CUS88287.1 heptosyltransferase-2 [Candidatus Kryptonium thompsoni]CUS88962.1 heptosyltransferase-2 [Candidatus Kryptonium thompsoni]